MIASLLGLFGFIAGWLFLERGKRKSAEAANSNLEVKEQVQQVESKNLEAKAEIKVEEKNREQIHEDSNAEKNKPVTDTELVDFFKKLQ